MSQTKTPHGNKLIHEVESLLLDEIAARLGVIAHHDALAKSVTTFMSRGAKVYVSNDNLSVSHQITGFINRAELSLTVSG